MHAANSFCYRDLLLKLGIMRGFQCVASPKLFRRGRRPLLHLRFGDRQSGFSILSEKLQARSLHLGNRRLEIGIDLGSRTTALFLDIL